MPRECEVREVLGRFRKEGWVLFPGKGSHVVVRKGGKTISVPTSHKEIALGTYRQIARLAGWR
ncbi:type II toxin-antitoxin system HicA family toxin [Enorma burkinafasonensis]|uniref:type II toxin-antitoxin system HicA family toxin n=1 Tax=Enorma burkinafasonensis TaxID=2590867 RepID=UPI0011A517F5|nr:type II toxin-antitoxin system HicA family toxin [Enorma burkinafasonensis]